MPTTDSSTVTLRVLPRPGGSALHVTERYQASATASGWRGTSAPWCWRVLIGALAPARGERPPLDELFSVLADPTRRAVLERLVHDGPATATQLAEHFPTTRQAIAKHLGTLAAADLVVAERDGREVRYRATTERLADVVTWLLGASRGWDRRSERLRATPRPAATSGIPSRGSR